MKRFQRVFSLAVVFILSVFLVAGPAFAKKKHKDENQNPFNVSYDKFNNQTIVGSKHLQVYQQFKPVKTAGDVDLEICYTFKGDVIKAKPAVIQLIFSSWTRSERTFSKNQSLAFLVDGQSFPIPVKAVYDLNADEGTEWLKYDLPFDQFKRLAAATKLECRVSNMTFEIKGGDLDMIKTVLGHFNSVP